MSIPEPKTLDGAESKSVPRRRVRFVWFPILVLIAAVVVVVLLVRSDGTDDLRYNHSKMVIGAALVLLTLWFAFFCVQSRRMRLAILLTPIITAAAFVGSVRTKLDGNLAFIGFEWRWKPATDKLLEVPDQAGETDAWQTTQFDYPRFLGPAGNGDISNVVLETDWENHAPREVWRSEIGAGWSGFAVVDKYAVTQEQRGEFEMVVCRRLQDGEIIWAHRDKLRFDSSHPSSRLGGPGPRATPTIHDGKVFTHGATGVLNCLEARTGKLIWSHDTIAENGSEVAIWGKSGSPVIVDGNVVVSVGGPGGKSLVAYDMATGAVAWSGGNRQSSYATPVLMDLAGVRQIVCVNENWVTAHRTDDGTVLWEHTWPGSSGSDASCSNPIPAGNDRVLLCKGYGIPSELLQVAQTADGQFTTKRLWQKMVMRTKMTNAIIHSGHVYGLDGGILQCIELKTGKKKWKRGRYGHGQVLLVGGVLLVTTERTGEVLLVEATPETHRVLARYQVLTGGGKVWNYPALAGKYLLVRNAEEAACYELPIRNDSHHAVAAAAASDDVDSR